MSLSVAIRSNANAVGVQKRTGRNVYCVYLQKNAAYERYETALQKIELDESQAREKAEEQAVLEKEFSLHKANSLQFAIIRHQTHYIN